MVTEPNWVRSILGCIVHLISRLACGRRAAPVHRPRGGWLRGAAAKEQGPWFRRFSPWRTLLAMTALPRPVGVDDPRQPTPVAGRPRRRRGLAAVSADREAGWRTT